MKNERVLDLQILPIHVGCRATRVDAVSQLERRICGLARNLATFLEAEFAESLKRPYPPPTWCYQY
jgi:hypothetical protein